MSQKNLNSEEINRYIGKKIVQARKEEGVTQQALADYLGISRIAMSSYETGRTRIAIPHLAMLSKALGRQIEYFVEDIFNKIKQKPKVEVKAYDIDENIKFELEMSLRNYLRHLGYNKEAANYKSASLLNVIDKEIAPDQAI